MEENNKKPKVKKHSKIWRWLCVFLGVGFLIYPYRKKIKKQIGQPFNHFALILNEECKYIPEKMQTLRNRFKKNLKDFFIPSNSNDHQPHGLSTRVLKVYAIVLIFIKLVTVGFLFFTYPSPAVLSQKISLEIFELTNISRSGESLNELSWNNELARAAQTKADDMVSNNYFAHIGPDGKQPWEWINKGGYYFLYMGENLAMDFSSAKIAHSAFQQSPTHWKNVMNPKYQDMGVGVAVGNINGRETLVLVEFFGAQKTVQPVIPIAQAADDSLAAATNPTSANQNVTVSEPPNTTFTVSEPPLVVNDSVSSPVPTAVVNQTNDPQPISEINQPAEPAIVPTVVVEEPIVNTEVASEQTNEVIAEPQTQELVGEIIVPEEIILA